MRRILASLRAYDLHHASRDRVVSTSIIADARAPHRRIMLPVYQLLQLTIVSIRSSRFRGAEKRVDGQVLDLISLLTTFPCLGPLTLQLLN